MIYSGASIQSNGNSGEHRPPGSGSASSLRGDGSLMNCIMLVPFLIIPICLCLMLVGDDDLGLSTEAVEQVNRISYQYETNQPALPADMETLEVAVIKFDRFEKLRPKADAIRHFLAVYHAARENPGQAIQVMRDTAWKTDQALKQGLPVETEEERRAHGQDTNWKAKCLARGGMPGATCFP